MAHIRKHPKSGRWQVRYREADGRERSKTFNRKPDAQRFAATVTADIARGEYLDPTAGKTTVAEYAARWLAMRNASRDIAASTLKRDTSYLNSLILPTFEHRQVATITTSEVGEWLANLDKAANTRGKALTILRSVLELAVTDHALRVNPASHVPNRPKQKPEREARALEDHELAAVLEAAEQVHPSTAAMVLLMARCGLRIGEAMALQRSDLDLAGSTVTIRGSLGRDGLVHKPKTDAGKRTIPMPPDVADRVRQHLASTSVVSIDGFVFTNTRGGPLRYSNWRGRVWGRIVDVSGVDAVPHDLRRTTATRLFRVDRWTPSEVQRYLGHDDPRVTLKIYTKVTEEHLPTPSTFQRVRGHLADT